MAEEAIKPREFVIALVDHERWLAQFGAKSQRNPGRKPATAARIARLAAVEFFTAAGAKSAADARRRAAALLNMRALEPEKQIARDQKRARQELELQGASRVLCFVFDKRDGGHEGACIFPDADSFESLQRAQTEQTEVALRGWAWSSRAPFEAKVGIARVTIALSRNLVDG